MPTAVPFEVLGPRAGFLGLDEPYCNYATAQVVVVPVGYERSSSYGLGSGRGPEALIAASQQVELFDEDRQCEPYRELGGIATLAPLALPPDADGAAVAERLRAVVRALLAAGKHVVTLGGEHTAIVGAVQAHADALGALDVLQFDAHSDLRPTYQDSPWSHACAMARVLPSARRLVQVGIRALDPREETARDARVTTFFARPLLRRARAEPCAGWGGEIAAALESPVYVTFDFDALDPALLPATGTPEPGGLGWGETLDLIDVLAARHRIVGLDFSELAPRPGDTRSEFTAARLVYKWMAAAWL